MNLENTIRKVSLSLAGLSLAASMSCSSNQQEKSYIHQSTAPAESAGERTLISTPEGEKLISVENKPVKVLKLHYHKQYSEQDLYQYYLGERPANKTVSFNAYKKRFDRLNHVFEGTKVDFLKLEDLNGNGKVGSRYHFP